MRLEGDSLSAKYIHPVLHTWRGPAEQLVRAAPPAFQYVVYGGRYQLLISLCHTGAGSGGREECQQEIETGYVSVQSELLPECQQNNDAAEFWRENTDDEFPAVSTDSTTDIPPMVQGSSATFQFTYRPCSRPQAYDTANVSMYEVAGGSSEASCLELVGGNWRESGAMIVARETVQVTGNPGGNTNITYTSPRVQVFIFFKWRHSMILICPSGEQDH